MTRYVYERALSKGTLERVKQPHPLTVRAPRAFIRRAIVETMERDGGEDLPGDEPV